MVASIQKILPVQTTIAVAGATPRDTWKKFRQSSSPTDQEDELTAMAIFDFQAR